MRKRLWFCHGQEVLSVVERYTFMPDRGTAVLQWDMDATDAVKLLALKPFYGLSCLFMCHVMGG